MKNIKYKQTMSMKEAGKLRRANGSVVLEGLGGVILITGIFIPLLIFFANIAAQLTLQAQVGNIANQAAQVSNAERYWLGLPRPGFSESIAADKATALAQKLCEQIGLRAASVSVIFDNSHEDYDLTICDVNVNAAGRIPFRLTVFGFDMARLFPGNVSARGVGAHAKVQPYALIHMDAPTIDDQSTRRPLGLNQRDVAVIPAYGFFYNATGQPGNPNVTPYGKGVANAAPENFMAMNHYHLKKSDIDHVVTTGEDIALSGWNRAHVYNGLASRY